MRTINKGMITILGFVMLFNVSIAGCIDIDDSKDEEKDEKNPDIDGDGIPNDWEEQNGLNPNDPSDASKDVDIDGLTNKEEYEKGTDPNNEDTDSDGYTDGNDLNPLKNIHVTVKITYVEFEDDIDVGSWFQPNKEGDPYFIVTINDIKQQSNKPVVKDVVSASLSVPFQTDVPDDTDKVNIIIELWDDDASGADDDHCDISPTNKTDLILTYSITSNSWTGDVTTGSASGSDDGSEEYDENDASIRFNIHI